MKRKIFSQISILLTMLVISITLSACGTKVNTKAAGNTSIQTSSNQSYSQGQVPAPRTQQS